MDPLEREFGKVDADMAKGLDQSRILAESIEAYTDMILCEAEFEGHPSHGGCRDGYRESIQHYLTRRLPRETEEHLSIDIRTLKNFVAHGLPVEKF